MLIKKKKLHYNIIVKPTTKKLYYRDANEIINIRNYQKFYLKKKKNLCMLQLWEWECIIAIKNSLLWF